MLCRDLGAGMGWLQVLSANDISALYLSMLDDVLAVGLIFNCAAIGGCTAPKLGEIYARHKAVQSKPLDKTWQSLTY